MEKLLVICGPTATGKTKLALYLAEVLGGEIVSADSRQVYRNLNIGTGKDLPEKAEFKIKDAKLGREYKIKGISVWGYDLVNPKSEYSVARYARYAKRIIRDIQARDKLPILVGGTGLYIRAVVDGISTAVVPRNKILRQNLENRSVAELFESLAQLDSIRAANLNISDRKNPRRLIRAIEVAQFARIKGLSVNRSMNDYYDSLFIGLKLNREELKSNIKKRVEERIKSKLELEIKSLLKSKVDWSSQAMTSLGYKEWREYFQGKMTRSEVIRMWEKNEIAYAKRQMTWFKKDKRINWFDIANKGYQKEVEKRVKKWYK